MVALSLLLPAVVVNVLLGFLIYYLVKSERYLTRTQEVGLACR